MIKINRLTQITERDGMKAMFLCECGTEKLLNFYHVRSGATQSCGCYRSEVGKAKDISDKEDMLKTKYLTQLKKREGRKAPFLCVCGKVLEISRKCVRSGHTKSCGCKKGELISSTVSTHKLTGTTEHNCWREIKNRCTNEKNKAYPNYGGRGIKMCERWLQSFENFLEDMGKKPDKTYSIDRIDNNKGYFPENCRWTSKRMQVANRRKVKGSSQYRGVSFYGKTGKWISSVSCNYVNGKSQQIRVGTFCEEQKLMMQKLLNLILRGTSISQKITLVLTPTF